MDTAGETTRVTIDIDVDSNPISGQVDLGGTQSEAFTGWSALADLLEEARTRRHPDLEHESNT